GRAWVGRPGSARWRRWQPAALPRSGCGRCGGASRGGGGGCAARTGRRRPAHTWWRQRGGPRAGAGSRRTGGRLALYVVYSALLREARADTATPLTAAYLTRSRWTQLNASGLGVTTCFGCAVTLVTVCLCGGLSLCVRCTAA